MVYDIPPKLLLGVQFFMLLVLLSEVNFFQRISKKIILALSDLSMKRIVLTHFYALFSPEAFQSENCNCDGQVSASLREVAIRTQK